MPDVSVKGRWRAEAAPCHFSHLFMEWEVIKSCISCEWIPSFIEHYPISLTFLSTLKFGMKQGLESQTGAQRQGDYVDKFDVSSKV